MDALCLSSSLALPFLIMTVNWDDRHLLAHAMASDFSVTWHSASQREQFVFSLQIKLQARLKASFYTACQSLLNSPEPVSAAGCQYVWSLLQTPSSQGTDGFASVMTSEGSALTWSRFWESVSAEQFPDKILKSRIGKN
jgi:predicted acylesterase/phospholipase RssA